MFFFHAIGAVTSTTGSGRWISTIGASGFLGVDIFFVLSGFVLALNYADERRHRSAAAWGNFLWKRLARVYPVHLAALTIFALLAWLLGGAFASEGRLSIAGLIQTITLTHGWSIPILKTWNQVSWSISCEWAAYLVFPLVAAAALRMPSRGLCVVTIGLLFAGLYYYITTGSLGYSSVAYGLPRIAAEFTAGVLVWRIRQLERETQKWQLVGVVSTIGMIIVSNAVANNRGQMMALYVMPVFAALLVYGLVRSDGPFERMLARPAWQWAGRISFAFYLVHFMALQVVSLVISNMGWRGNAAAACMLVAALLVAGGLAHLLHALVETPARAAMLSMRGPGLASASMRAS